MSLNPKMKLVLRTGTYYAGYAMTGNEEEGEEGEGPQDLMIETTINTLKYGGPGDCISAARVDELLKSKVVANGYLTIVIIGNSS